MVSSKIKSEGGEETTEKGTRLTFLSFSRSCLQAIIGQWLAIFSAVVLEEHFIFRKGSFPSYNAEFTWNDPKAIPVGFGALGAFCAGAVGAWAGMSQVWYIGPLGKLVGGDANPYGESSCCFSSKKATRSISSSLSLADPLFRRFHLCRWGYRIHSRRSFRCYRFPYHSNFGKEVAQAMRSRRRRAFEPLWAFGLPFLPVLSALLSVRTRQFIWLVSF